MRNYIISFQEVLYYLIPLALLTGPFIPDLFVSLIAITFLYLSVSEKKMFYFKNKFVIFFILYCLYLVFASLISDSQYLSLTSSLFFFRFLLFALAGWYLINEVNHFRKNFAIALVVAFSFALFDGYYQYFYQINLFGYSGVATRMSLPLNDNLLLGNYLIRILPLLLAMLFILNLNKTNKTIILVIFLILSDVLVYLSGERTAFILFFILTLFLILTLNNLKFVRLFTFVFSIIIIVFISINNPKIYERNITNTLNQTGINTISADEKERGIILFSPEHHSHIVTAFRMFLDKPIFGHGPKTFRIKCSDDKYKYDDLACSTHPHNILAQIISETGIIGLMPYLILIYLFLSKLYGHLKSMLIKQSKNILNDYEIILLSSFLISLWPFIPSLNMFNNWINVIFFMPLGFYLHHTNKNLKE